MDKTVKAEAKAEFKGSEWHLIDANNKVLGRIATQVAGILMGKHRTDWAKNLVAPTFVVVINSDKVALTGKKEEQKMYRHYTGYPGGLRERPAGVQRSRDSRKIIYFAVAGMLPKNSLRDKRLRHLKIYAGAEHPHRAQLSN